MERLGDVAAAERGTAVAELDGVACRVLPSPEGALVTFADGRSGAGKTVLADALAARVDRIAVVGGGYIGSELAAALVQQGVDTVLVHSTKGLGDDVFPADLADHFAVMDRGEVVLAGPKAGMVETEVRRYLTV